MEKVKDKKALTLSIANRYYSFLWVEARENIITLANSMDFLCPGKTNIQEMSRLIGRHLYKIAKTFGWRRKKNGGWEKIDKSNTDLNTI